MAKLRAKTYRCTECKRQEEERRRQEENRIALSKTTVSTLAGSGTRGFRNGAAGSAQF